MVRNWDLGIKDSQEPDITLCRMKQQSTWGRESQLGVERGAGVRPGSRRDTGRNDIQGRFDITYDWILLLWTGV